MTQPGSSAAGSRDVPVDDPVGDQAAVLPSLHREHTFPLAVLPCPCHLCELAMVQYADGTRSAWVTLEEAGEFVHWWVHDAPHVNL